jgi:hypothetical protein
VARPDDPQGDLPAVGYQDLVEHTATVSCPRGHRLRTRYHP